VALAVRVRLDELNRKPRNPVSVVGMDNQLFVEILRLCCLLAVITNYPEEIDRGIRNRLDDEVMYFELPSQSQRASIMRYAVNDVLGISIDVSDLASAASATTGTVSPVSILLITWY